MFPVKLEFKSSFNTEKRMPEHGFSLTSIFLHKDRKSDSDLIRENTGHRKPECWQILRNIIDINFNFLPRFQGNFLSFREKASMTVVHTLSQPAHNVLRTSLMVLFWSRYPRP